MPKYRIHFADGQTVDKDLPDGNAAKHAAKHERKRETGAEEPSDPRIRVVRVEDLSASA